MTDNAREARRRRKTELALRALADEGNPKKAAEFLGISERTLQKQVRDYCLEHGFDTPLAAGGGR